MNDQHKVTDNEKAENKTDKENTTENNSPEGNNTESTPAGFFYSSIFDN